MSSNRQTIRRHASNSDSDLSSSIIPCPHQPPVFISRFPSAAQFYFVLYAIIIILSPRDAPQLFLSVLPLGSLGSRVASFCLFVHVGISFSINSMALCRGLIDSFDGFGSASPASGSSKSWWIISAIVAVTVLAIVAVVPFFASLTSLIGALTTIPLTLTLPIIFGAAAKSGGAFLCKNAVTGGRGSFDFFFVLICTSLTVMGTVSSVWKIMADHGILPGEDGEDVGDDRER